eukprot:3355634-Rhodomonas_salina.2
MSSCSLQSQRCEPSTSDVKHWSCTRTTQVFSGLISPCIITTGSISVQSSTRSPFLSTTLAPRYLYARRRNIPFSVGSLHSATNSVLPSGNPPIPLSPESTEASGVIAVSGIRSRRWEELECFRFRACFVNMLCETAALER